MQLKTKRIETQRKPTSSKPPILLNLNHQNPNFTNQSQFHFHSSNNNEGPNFPIGSQVEVSSDEEGFKGAWFLATVIKPPSSSSSFSSPSSKIFVEYINLLAEENGSDLLREYVDVKFVRPRPPVDDVNEVVYEVNDVVDAYYQDGWWCGVVTEVVDPNSKYRVFFSNPPDEMLFHPFDLRIHKTWIHGNWLVPHNKRMRKSNFNPGTAVEVNIVPAHSRDVWFPATCVKQLPDNSFLVEYQSSSEAGLQEVSVDSDHIRPSPPISTSEAFSLLEKVDAFLDGRWLSGVVTKILADGHYIVYFKHTKKEEKLSHSDLRLQMDWTNGKWIHSSQDTSTTSTLDKRSGLTNGGYKGKKSAPADAGVMKGNGGLGRISSVTLSSSENNLQAPGSEKADYNSVTPSYKRLKQTSNNDDRHSRRPDEEAACDGISSPVTSCSQVKQTDILGSVMPGDLGTSTPVEQGRSILKKSENSSQPSDSTKGVYEKHLPTPSRKKGRPRKLSAVVADFQADNVEQIPIEQVPVEQTPVEQTPIEQAPIEKKPIKLTPTIGDSLKPFGPLVVGLTHDVKMIDSLAETSGQLEKLGHKAIAEATSADHESIDGDTPKEGEVTNLKRKRGRPPKVSIRLGCPKPEETVTKGVASEQKEGQDVINIEGSPETPPANEVEKPIVEVEPPAADQLTPSTDSGPGRVRLINDHFRRLGDVRRTGARNPARRRGKKHRKFPFTAANGSISQAELPSEDADVGDKLKVRIVGACDGGLGRDGEEVLAVISSTASDDDKPLSAWLEEAHSPRATDGRRLLQSDEAVEKRHEIGKAPVAQFREKVQEERSDLSSGKANQYNDIGKRQDGIPAQSAAIILERQEETPASAQSTAIIPRRPDETATRLPAIEPRENQGLPFAKNSPVWYLIDSMEVLKRIPQNPHFFPLYNCKEECREGLAIGSMVTFTSLAERISKACFDDPKNLLDGYLEALVDLEELGFNVVPLKTMLNKLLSIKRKHEHTQDRTQDMESQIMEKNKELSKISDEIADLGKKIAELKGKESLAMSKKEKKEAEIGLLQSSVDAVKEDLERSREEFARVAASLG